LKLINNNILIVSPESWGTNFVSKHHYALELAKNNSVYFINSIDKQYKLSKIGPSLYTIDCHILFRGIGKLPKFLSAIFTKLELERLEKKTKVKFDIIWNFDSSRFFNLSNIQNKLKIAHLVDLSEHFQRPALSKSSDICLCSSEVILHEMKKYNKTAFNIGHGVQNSDDTISISTEEKAELNTKFKYKAAYVGNLSIKYLDWKTYYQIVKENDETAFYFIGPLGVSNLSKTIEINSHFNEIKLLPNSIFLGEKPSTKILSYLKEMDILMMIYNTDKYKDQLSNPHKTLEYLASGKVVVSSWTEEYKNKLHLLEMVKSNKELPAKFQEVITNIDYYNSDEKQAKRRAFALKNTYDKKIQQIEQLIETHDKF